MAKGFYRETTSYGGDYKRGKNVTMRTVTQKGGRLSVVNRGVRVDRHGEVHLFTESSSVNIFGIVMVVLLFATIIGILSSGRTFTFMGFLEFLSTVPDIDITVLTNGLTNSVASINVEWVRQLLMPFVSAINIIMFLFGGIAQALIFIVWFASYLFGF